MADDTAADLSTETAAEIPAEPPAEPPVEAAALTPDEPAAEPTAEPAAEAPLADTSVVAATLEVPALAVPSASGADREAGEGGEWELLTGQVRAWLESGQLQKLWAQARTPITILAALIALLVVLRVYSALLGALDSLPLVPGLLELVGVIWLVSQGVPKLVRNSERERLVSGLRQRWQSFLGRS